MLATITGLILEPLLGGDMFAFLTSQPDGIVSHSAARFFSSCILSAVKEHQYFSTRDQVKKIEDRP